jgi:LCP family protein required for cell wall assembly
MSELRTRSNRSAKNPVVARHGRQRKQGPWGAILAFVGAGLVVLLVSGGSLAAIVVNQLSSNIKRVTLIGETEGPPPSIGAYEGGFNILIVGSDKCEDDSGCAGRGSANLNDVTMLLHVSADQTNAVAVSIPRDLVVPIPSCPAEDGSGNNYAMAGRPINETLFYGGLPCTVLTVEALTGLDIQFAGLITFNGVIQMTDAVGGVDVCVTEPIFDKYTGLNVPAGVSNLSGGQALAFLRTRHGVGDGSDLTRISSQQVYLSSLVRTLKSAGTLGDPFKVYALAQAATTNMTLSSGFSNLDTLASIALALKDIPIDRVTFVQYPGTTGQPGIYLGKVAPVKGKADELFAKIKADEPFLLESAGDGRGSELNPNAPVAVAEPVPSGSAVAPAEPAAPLATITGVRGQSAADYTCAIANN